MYVQLISSLSSRGRWAQKKRAFLEQPSSAWFAQVCDTCFWQMIISVIWTAPAFIERHLFWLTSAFIDCYFDWHLFWLYLLWLTHAYIDWQLYDWHLFWFTTYYLHSDQLGAILQEPQSSVGVTLQCMQCIVTLLLYRNISHWNNSSIHSEFHPHHFYLSFKKCNSDALPRRRWRITFPSKCPAFQRGTR